MVALGRQGRRWPPQTYRSEEQRSKAVGQKAQLVMLRPHLDDLPEIPPLPRGYTLRTYEERDMPSLVATLADSFHEYWDDARVARELTAAPDVQTVYVVSHGDRVVGTASSRFVPERYPNAGYIHWVGVTSEHLRRGLASALLIHVLHEFRERGYPTAVLETDDFRIPAIRSYFKLGFIPIYDVRTEDHRARWSNVMSNVVTAP
jgi:mycothiol synthase